MFHSNASSFNQRQPKAGPSALPLPRFQQDNTNPKPMAFGKRNPPQPELADLMDRKISTNSRIKKDEKYKKEMYLAYVNNALLQKTRGNNLPFDDLVKLFSSNQSQNPQTATTTSQLRLCLSALSHVVSQFERTHSALIEAIVNLPWAVMDSFFSKSYTSFIGMLVSARPQYLSLVLEKIAVGFTFRFGAQITDGFVSTDGTAPVTRRIVYERIHGLLEHLLSLIPTLPASLQPLLVRNFPHKRQEKVDQETYIRNLLRVTEYCPALTDRILAMIIDRIIQVDVEIQVELEDLEDTLENEEVFVLDPFDIVIGQEGSDSDSNNDSDGDAFSDISSEAGSVSDNERNVKAEQDVSYIRDMVTKLDSMMKLLFEYFERVNKRYDNIVEAPAVTKSIPAMGSHPVVPLTTPENYDSAHQSKKSLFIILLSIFDRTIIRTFKSRYTQFLVFWYSSLDPEFADMFQGMLVSKALLEEDQSIVTRAAAASYIASFVSRALFVDGPNARMVVGLMCDFLGHHLDECAVLGKDFDPKASYHTVFYTVAQAVFLIFCFRWRDFQIEEADPDELITEPVASKKWIPKLDVIPRVIKSELNPLKQFARVAHATNFVYCYTIISNNQRSDGHVVNAKSSDRSRPAASTLDAELGTFFPFDPYKLPLSNSYIESVYRDWASVAIDEDDEEDEEDVSDGGSNVEDELDDGTLNSTRRPVNIPGMEEADITGGLSNSFGGMSISPVRPPTFTSFAI
ncbi:hypothetical protein Clacol_001329 [Clathrus columnatus]|uniref:RNA polymerase I-specific transcription initiation factor RRN3 n=1 Tax=Clathrus columnatus TaxID=1419009 RepID=A0AAV5A1F5_9AGAM|nr:hypothetical protein Clacol_001329 [Clathrus columnatus]